MYNGGKNTNTFCWCVSTIIISTLCYFYYSYTQFHCYIFDTYTYMYYNSQVGECLSLYNLDEGGEGSSGQIDLLFTHILHSQLSLQR